MFTRVRVAFALAGVLLTNLAAAQEHDPVSPGVGSAVLLATNSIQIERDTIVASGDLVVNDASPGPVLGEAQLSLDRNVRTPAGAMLAANSVDIDRDALVGGDVHFNTLSNEGTIVGAQVTPLPLPVYSTLPPPVIRSTGFTHIVVPPGETVDIEESEDGYASLSIGKGGTARLLGGGYAFTTVDGGKDAVLACAAGCNVYVSGRLSFDQVGTIGGGGSVDARQILIHVGGANGTSKLTLLPAVSFGRNATVAANLSAPNGSMIFDREVSAEGSFFARDILIGRNSILSLASSLNLRPLAHAQSVFTNDAQTLSITLSGTDPEGQPLEFSIATGPDFGSLSPIVPASSSTAVVTYAPSSSANLLDRFTFRVTDPSGQSGTAVVTINPDRLDPPPPPPATVIAVDLTAAVAMDFPETLVLTAQAPDGVSLTFSIVANTGPFLGSLGPVTNGDQATVVYTADAGATGVDGFQFEACGVVAGNTVCDTALFTLRLLPPRVEPPQTGAPNIEVTTGANEPIVISLGDSAFASRNFRVRPNAAFLDSVEVAGTVADSNNDGLGDNHMPLPASVPLFMSAGTGLSGGPGSNGEVKMHFEWDISTFGGLVDDLTSATVLLNTHRGTIDSLDTFFYHVYADGDSLLTDSDYQLGGERIKDAVMDVPSTMAVGADGTFSFSVLDELKSAVEQGQDTLIIQGLVHDTGGPARGLEVRTSAQINRDSGLEPMLALTTPGVTPPRTYQVITLPANGTLFDGATQITTVPHVLALPLVTFIPATGFIGNTQFVYQVDADQALVRVRVVLTDCATDPSKCDDGRD